MKYITKEKCAS